MADTPGRNIGASFKMIPKRLEGADQIAFQDSIHSPVQQKRNQSLLRRRQQNSTAHQWAQAHMLERPTHSKARSI